VVTHSKGVKIYNCAGLEFEYNCAEDVKVSNYSGAGDCFAATFALAVAHKFPLKDCMEIAYKAGQKYVQSHHNKPVTPLDLYDTKYVHPKDLKNRDFKLVVTNGCYDILTAAHISTFEFAKTKGDKLLVLINSDESIKRLKGESRPIVPLEQRKKILSSLECVDYVIDFSEDSPYNTIKEIQPDVLVKGADYQGKIVNSAELVQEVCFAPLLEGVSTSNIVERIKNEKSS
jgi:D-beta-D-heptose 7-phosphate kinase/D-beta-D-heptose 1-phosphate adenosyltransferase